jgi:histone demethylase JARID1
MSFYRIRAEAEKFGICKIVPPKNWAPKCNVNMSNPNKFPTKLQKINTLQEGQGFEDGNTYDIATYKKMADEFYLNWIKKYHNGKEMTAEEAVKDYWDLVETNTRSVAVEYGNDLDTSAYSSGFEPTAEPHERTKFIARKNDNQGVPEMDSKYYALSGWNLNNLPTADGSVLKYLRTPVNGVNVPWLYVGMLFTSFCWHNEDNYFYSINYNHFGAVKQWYGVPGAFANIFESVNLLFCLI